MKRTCIAALVVVATMSPAIAVKGQQGLDGLFPGCLEIFIGTYSIGWW